MASPRNPYRTAPGSDPPELAGRDGELGAGKLAIAMAAACQPAKPIVFTGLRGMGKTSLLRRVARHAKLPGPSRSSAADPSLRFGEVMRRELVDARAKSTTLPSRLSAGISGLIEYLPKISYEMPHDTGSITLSGQDLSEAFDRSGGDSLEDVVQDLNDQLHAHARFMMIGLDEIQESSADDLLRIIRVVHKTAGTGASPG